MTEQDRKQKQLQGLFVAEEIFRQNIAIIISIEYLSGQNFAIRVSIFLGLQCSMSGQYF